MSINISLEILGFINFEFVVCRAGDDGVPAPVRAQDLVRVS